MGETIVVTMCPLCALVPVVCPLCALMPAVCTCVHIVCTGGFCARMGETRPSGVWAGFLFWCRGFVVLGQPRHFVCGLGHCVGCDGGGVHTVTVVNHFLWRTRGWCWGVPTGSR